MLSLSGPAEQALQAGGGGGVYSRQTRNLAALAAIGVQSGSTRYDLPATVTIPDKSATMVMLLDQRVPGEIARAVRAGRRRARVVVAPVPRRALHQQDRRAARARAARDLLRRVIRRAGDDRPAARRRHRHGSVRASTAASPSRSTREHREEGARLYHIEAGSVTVARDAVSLTKYRLKNGGDRPAKLMIKHPRAGGRAHEQLPRRHRGQRRHRHRAGSDDGGRARDGRPRARRAPADDPHASTGWSRSPTTP